MEETPRRAGTPPLPDWGLPVARAGPPLPLVPLGALIAVSAALAALAGPAAAAGGAIAVLVLAALAAAATPGGVLRREGAVRARPHDAPRLHNLIEGVSRDLGIAPPEVWISPGPPNAVALHLTKPIVCMRKDLLDTFTRTELEAAVAFLLTGIATGSARLATLPVWASLRAEGLDPAALDVYAASVTRYPPALAAALSRCSPATERGLWLAGRGDVERRAAALLDL